MRRRIVYSLALLAMIVSFTACSGKESAKSYYNAGMEALESEKYENAAAYFEKAIQLKDDKADYYINYAAALTMLGKYDEAIVQYDKAVPDVESSITDKNKKRALRGKGVIFYKQGEFAKAEELFKEALTMDTEKDLNEDISCYLADTYMQQEKYDQALAVVDRLLENEKEAYVYAIRAKISVAKGDIEAATKDYEEAIKLEKEDYTYYILKYEMLKEAGKEDEANKSLEDALQLEAKSAKEKYQKAKVMCFQGNYEEAKTQLLAITGEYSKAYELLGDIYYANQDYSNAIDSYVTYLGVSQEHASPGLYNQLANCSIKLESYEQALEYINQGLSLGDNTAQRELKYNEVLVYENLGDFNKAYDLAVSYVSEYPEDENMARELVFLETRKTK